MELYQDYIFSMIITIITWKRIGRKIGNAPSQGKRTKTIRIPREKKPKQIRGLCERKNRKKGIPLKLNYGRSKLSVVVCCERGNKTQTDLLLSTIPMQIREKTSLRPKKVSCKFFRARKSARREFRWLWCRAAFSKSNPEKRKWRRIGIGVGRYRTELAFKTMLARNCSQVDRNR